MNQLVPLMCLVLAAMPAFADDDDCRYSAERTARASTDGIKRIVVRAGAGSLAISGQPGGRELSAVGIACAPRESQLDEMQLRLEREGHTLRLSTDMPESTFRLSNWFGSQHMDLTVKLPLGIALEVHDGSGETRISNVGALSVDDGSGALHLTRIQGALDIKDGSGEIEVREVDGSVRLSDGSGAVSIGHVRGDLVITEDGSGEIEIEDVQGNVTIGNDGSGEIRIDRVSGSVRIENDGSGGIFISNVKHDVLIEEDGSGDIDVRDIGGNFKVGKAGSGDIQHARVGGSVQIGGEIGSDVRHDDGDSKSLETVD